METRKEQNKAKLPLTADWWRDVDENKRINSIQMEYLENPSPDLISLEDKNVVVHRDSTIDSSGDIDLSNIIFPAYVETDREIYERNCQELNCASSKKFGKTLDSLSTGLSSDDINMAHYGLTSTGLRATVISIANLSQCSTIDFHGNKLNSSSLATLIGVIKKTSVTEINLSSTCISKFGPKILHSWISSTMKIKRMHLRDNGFNDDDGMVLFEALAGNRSIVYMDMAENNFCIRCGDALKKLFDENDILEELDLSWNYLRLGAILSIAKGLKKNNGLKVLNLSWNGVEDVGAKEIGLSLKENDCLQELGLVSSRITDSGLCMLLKGLEKNAVMKCLRVGQNNITQKTAEKILESLRNGELRDCGIETLDFTNNIFKNTFQSVINGVKANRSGFNCPFGYEDLYGKRKKVTLNPVQELLSFLKLFLVNSNINVMELFGDFDIDGSMKIPIDKFKICLKDMGIPMTDNQMDILTKFLDRDGSGSIDYSELLISAENDSKKG